MSGFSDAVGFAKGTGEGLWDGAKGMVQGVGDLAKDGYKLATDSRYRTQAWHDAVRDAKVAGDFAETAITDPSKAASGVVNATTNAWHSVQTAYDEAASHGQGSEYVGKVFGQGAIMVGGAVVPGAGAADAVSAAGDAGRLAEMAGDVGKAEEIAGDGGKRPRQLKSFSPKTNGSSNRWQSVPNRTPAMSSASLPGPRMRRAVPFRLRER